jgi:hypothetical protein
MSDGSLMEPAYSIDERLLLDCASVETDAAGLERIQRGIDAGINWKRFAELADRHRLTPLVWGRLKEICPDVLEIPETQVMRHRTRMVVQRNLQLTQEMLSLVKVLESHGIVSVPLKGPLLAMAAFGSLSAREFGDIDLLVQPKDLDQACEVIRLLGYEPEFRLTPRQRAAYIGMQHAFTYYRRRDKITVELHWRLYDRYLSFPLSDRELWANIGFTDVFGARLRCLKPEHNFIFLCMHGAKHFWDRVEWISCLNALACSQPASRVPLIVAEAARLRSTRLLSLGLTLADQLSPCPGTQRFLKAMRLDPVVGELATTVWQHIFADELSGWNKEVYRFRFYMKAREYLWDRLRLVWSATVRIPPPQSSAWNERSLPESALFLYYVLRPIGLLRKVGLQGLRGVLRT